MSAAVAWTATASQQLKDALKFNGGGRASAILRELPETEAQIAQFPGSGSPVPDAPDTGYRRCLVASHWLYYLHRGPQVHVLAFMHTDQDFEPRLALDQAPTLDASED